MDATRPRRTHGSEARQRWYALWRAMRFADRFGFDANRGLVDARACSPVVVGHALTVGHDDYPNAKPGWGYTHMLGWPGRHNRPREGAGT